MKGNLVRKRHSLKQASKHTDEQEGNQPQTKQEGKEHHRNLSLWLFVCFCGTLVEWGCGGCNSIRYVNNRRMWRRRQNNRRPFPFPSHFHPPLHPHQHIVIAVIIYLHWLFGGSLAAVCVVAALRSRGAAAATAAGAATALAAALTAAAAAAHATADAAHCGTGVLAWENASAH